MSDLARDLLKGAVDLHIHAAPDIVPRLLDDLALARAARDAGMAAIVLKILVDHPELWLIGMSVEDQRALAAKGVVMEICIRSVTAPGHGESSPKGLAERITAVGPEHVVMATDFGQVDSPPAPDGMRWYIAQMLECGISAEDIERMTKANPSRLLGV